MTMLGLDMPTILKLLSFGNFVILLILLVSTNEFAIKQSYYSFITGKVFQACAWALLAARGSIPALHSVFIGNTILLAGFALEAHGLTSVEEFRKPRAVYYSIVIGVFLAIFWNFARAANQYAVVTSAFVAIIFFSVSVQILRIKKITKVRWMLSTFYAADGMALIARAAVSAIDVKFMLFSDNLVQEITFTLTYGLLVMSGIGFILLKKERIDRMLAETMKELENLARVDSLTGLMNRRTLDAYLRFTIAENRRRHEPVAVIMIDIDFFKNYNDFYGHVAGDACLAAVATEIKKHCERVTDLAARFGGEEFTVIMWNMTGTQAFAIAEEIRAGVASLGIEHMDSIVSEVVTISLGVFSAIPESDVTTNEWYIQHADDGLYKAKNSGRNRCCSGGSENPVQA
jgi:diguanylate cyclase (GGDEF)-like protein